MSENTNDNEDKTNPESSIEAAEQNQEAIEAKAAMVLDRLSVLGKENKAEQQENGEEWLKEKMSLVPAQARKRLMKRNEKMVAMGIDDAHRAELLADDITNVEDSYVDTRFKFDDGERILKERFGKEVAREWIDEVLSKPELSNDDLKKVARISLDANGLKSVNDLAASHEKGDEYLKRVADVIRQNHSRFVDIIREAGGGEVLPLTGGGDEYSLLIKGEKPLDADLLKQAVQEIEAQVAAIDVSDLLDMDDQATKLRFMGITAEEYRAMSPEEQGQMEADYRRDVPEGFSMKASISGGVETLDKGLMRAVADPRDTKRLDPEEKDYSKAVGKIMGGLWDVSDQAANEAKDRFKKGLDGAEATPEERALSQIFSRNQAEREAKKRADAQEAKVQQAESLMKQVADLQNLRQQLGDAKFADAVQELMSKFNPES